MRVRQPVDAPRERLLPGVVLGAFATGLPQGLGVPRLGMSGALGVGKEELDRPIIAGSRNPVGIRAPSPAFHGRVPGSRTRHPPTWSNAQFPPLQQITRSLPSPRTDRCDARWARGYHRLLRCSRAYRPSMEISPGWIASPHPRRNAALPRQARRCIGEGRVSTGLTRPDRCASRRSW